MVRPIVIHWGQTFYGASYLQSYFYGAKITGDVARPCCWLWDRLLLACEISEFFVKCRIKWMSSNIDV